jgi:hypothetical protein
MAYYPTLSRGSSRGSYYPSLSTAGAARTVVDAFTGYNHNLKLRDGEFYETKNLTTKHYPLLATRPKRGRLSRSFTKLQAIIAKDSLYWVDNGTLYANGYATGLTGLQTERETQLVSMGAYICIFPDKKYINTQNLSDFGSMGAEWSYSGQVVYSMCHADGTIYQNVTKGASAPSNPANGAVWIDTADGDVKEYSIYTQTWTVIETVYTRLDFTTMGQIPAAFKEQDGVNISGAYFDDLNGSHILISVGGDQATTADYIVVIGIQETPYTQTEASITVSRKVPDMDFVCEAQNRLWGCFYGNDGTQNLNEIYCCSLGDFRNWEQYLGISTDSWRASRGSDGPWTGCVNYLGTPTFFKENVIHPVSVSSVGAHQIGDIPARGVQQGSHKSLAIVNETLYYKSRTGVVAYQGGIPADVSQALGEEKYYQAAAGVFGQRYYISMKDAADVWHLFCYDAGKRMWMHEDELHAEGFAQVGDELYALANNGITAINGTDGAPEGDFDWSAVTGLMHYEQGVSSKGTQTVRYLSQFNLRMSMDGEKSWMQMYIEYDSSGVWEFCGHFHMPTLSAVTIPIRPRRCDHLRIKLEGHGPVRMYSLARVLERGSDR